MEIQSAAGTTTSSTSSSSSSTSKNVLGKDEFLKMLIAQLKHQDPLNPMDGTAFTAQLAQFSSLEQLQNLNTKFETFTTQQQSLGNSQTVNLIGREVTAKGNTITADGSAKTLSYSLAGNAASGIVRIYNSYGEQVDAVAFKSQSQGMNSVTWNSASSGTYTFDVTAVDSKGNSVSADALMQGEVTGVTFRDGAAYLTVGGKEIAYSSVVSVKKSQTN